MTRSHLLLALVALPLAACSLPGGPPMSELAAEVNATLASETVVIAPGDVLQIRFRLESQYDQEVVVGPDGKSDFLDVGTLHVAGYTTERVRDQLREVYEPFAPGAELSLSVVDAAPRTVTVFGEVGAPGEIALGPDQRLTLVEAIGQAGGFRKHSAWLSCTLLVRWDADEERQLYWTIDARPENWESDIPLYLQAFDVVFVPNTTIDRVGIWVDNYIRRMLPLPIPAAY